MIYQDAQRRYLNDPIYKALVDSLIGAMVDLKLTPGEIRDCAMFAANRFEQMHVMPSMVSPQPFSVYDVDRMPIEEIPKSITDFSKYDSKPR